jgi:phage terminase large subunit
MEYDRRVDPESAAHVWDGEFSVRNAAAVFHGKWIIDSFETPTDAAGPYQGADWGFSQDPTVLTRSWIKDKKLFIEYEAYKVGCEIEDTPELFDRIPMARNYRIYGDVARPETISHVKNKGFRIEGAEKWKGSVEDGIAFIRSFEKIIIHPRCKHTAYEARMYSHKVDRLTGDPLPDIEDKHNHCWDSVRYGLFKLIRISKGKGKPSIRSL